MQTGLIDPTILHRASTTLLRLRHSEVQSEDSDEVTAGVPYPGMPVSSDKRVVACQAEAADQAIFDVKVGPNRPILNAPSEPHCSRQI